jgi:hypothetical protein
MTDLNWHQFSRLAVWSPELAATFHYLGLEVPPGRAPRRFLASAFSVDVTLDHGTVTGFLCWRARPMPCAAPDAAANPGQGTSLHLATGDGVVDFLAPVPSYGATGVALRQWLRWWGWEPPARAGAPPPPPPPPMIT